MEQSTKKPIYKLAKKGISFVDTLINLGVALLLLLMVSYGTYSIYDSRQVLNSAQETQYATYKPEAKNNTSFEELAAINPDVLGWLSVYGTHIDYPLVQGKTNEDYLNTDPFGKYKLSGSIFLDYRNKKDFSDFNTIIYGHHMAKSAMFGDLDKFNQKSFFDTHLYGNLYYSEKHHGIEFFAFINGDAFDPVIYQTIITDETQTESYVANLKSKAKFYREIGIKANDHLVLLSTCTSDYTNGRHILVGRITEQAIAIPEELKAEEKRTNADFSTGISGFFSSLTYTTAGKIILFVVGFLVLLLWYVLLIVKRKKQDEGTEDN